MQTSYFTFLVKSFQQQTSAWIQMKSYKRGIKKGRESLLCKKLHFGRAAGTTLSIPRRQAKNGSKIMGHLILQFASFVGRGGSCSRLLDEILC